MRIKVSLRKVRLTRGGYEAGKYGSYYGVGAPVYRARTDVDVLMEFRASNRNEAKQRVREAHPNARFYN